MITEFEYNDKYYNRPKPNESATANYSIIIIIIIRTRSANSRLYCTRHYQIDAVIGSQMI